MGLSVRPPRPQDGQGWGPGAQRSLLSWVEGFAVYPVSGQILT